MKRLLFFIMLGVVASYIVLRQAEDQLVMPVVVGVIFQIIGERAGGAALNAGWESVAGLLMVGTIAGVLLATYLNRL